MSSRRTFVAESPSGVAGKKVKSSSPAGAASKFSTMLLKGEGTCTIHLTEDKENGKSFTYEVERTKNDSPSDGGLYFPFKTKTKAVKGGGGGATKVEKSEKSEKERENGETKKKTSRKKVEVEKVEA